MENWTEKIKKILKEIRTQRRWRVVLTTMAGAVVFVTTYALILPGITLEEEVALEDPGIFLEGDFAEDAFAEDTFAEDAEAGLPADGEDGFFLSDDMLFAEDQELDGFADADLSGGLDTLEDYEEYDGSADADGLSLDADAAGLDDGIMADGFLIEDGEDLALTDELSTDHFRIRMDEDAMVPEGTAISVKEVKDTQSYQEIAAQLLGADVSAIQVYEIRLKKDDQEILPMADVTVETTLEAARNADAVLAFDDPAYAKQAAIVEQDDKLVFETDEITYIAFCSMSGAQDVEGLAEILPDAMEEAGWEAEALEAGEDTLEDTAVEDALVEEVIEEAQSAIDKLSPYVTGVPIVIDVEMISGGDGRMDDLTPAERTDLILKFCEVVSNAGYKPYIYYNTEMSILYVDIARLEGIPKWYASYSSDFFYPYDIDILQYSATGRVAGISGDVDMDICFRPFW